MSSFQFAHALDRNAKVDYETIIGTAALFDLEPEQVAWFYREYGDHDVTIRRTKRIWQTNTIKTEYERVPAFIAEIRSTLIGERFQILH